MDILHQGADFKILKKHENRGITFLKVTEIDSKTLFDYKNVSFSDLKQGYIGDCGLIASLASMSQRSEFLTEISPQIEQTSEGVKIKFNMFYKGNKETVTIDDALPFDENNSLVYARSAQKDNLYLSSFLEKVFIKHACNESYDLAIGTSPLLAFSTFSNCMVCYYFWRKQKTKRNLMDHLAFEVDNKSSVVLSITPNLENDPDAKVDTGHSYAVMGYNQKHKALKLYDPRCHPAFCVSNEKLPSSFTTDADADANKGELWVTMDQLKNRVVSMSCLHTINMYESVFEIKPKIILGRSDRNNFLCLDTCIVSVEETSTFMINFFLYSHALRHVDLFVTTNDGKRKYVSLKYELPNTWSNDKNNTTCKYFQRFKLKPNTYVFSLDFKLANDDLTKEVSFLMKIGSVSKCTFKELHSKPRRIGMCTIL